MLWEPAGKAGFQFFHVAEFGNRGTCVQPLAYRNVHQAKLSCKGSTYFGLFNLRLDVFYIGLRRLEVRHRRFLIFLSRTPLLVQSAGALFLLGSKDQLQRQFRLLMKAAVNEEKNSRIHHVLSTANRCFSGFIVGQTLNGIFLGLLTWLGMKIFGMPYALMVGVLSGTTSLIPIIGGYIGAALGTFLVFTANPGMALWFLLFIVVLQTISGNTIYPRLLGSSVGIPSLWVLAAITIGGGIGGIGGMLVSVPVTATLYALIHEWVRKKNDAPAD